MKTGTLRRAALASLIYIAIFILIVLVQFSRSSGFSFRADKLLISAEFSKTEEGRPLSLRVNFAGLVLEVEPRRPLRLTDRAGREREARLASVRRVDEGVEIGFEEGLTLRIQPAPGGALVMEATASEFSMVRIPYTLAGTASFVDGQSGLVLDSTGGPYALSLPRSAFKDGYLSFKTEKAGESRLSLAKTARPAKPVAVAASSPERAAKSKEEYRKGIDTWIENAWLGLSESRFDQARIAWRDAAGSGRFTETALAAYVAEAFRRGKGPEALAKVKSARERYPRELSHLTVPYLGDTIRRMQELEVKDAQEVKRLQGLIQARDPSLFEKENLLHWLMDRSPYTLAQDALRFASEIDVAKLSLRQAVGVLACVVESRSYLKPEENPFAYLGKSADKVYASVRAVDAGLFLEAESGGAVDFRLSLHAGTLLIDYGQAENRQDLVGIGQGLVESVLGRSDKQAFMPATARISGSSLAAVEGSLAPEEVYPLIAENPYYPREVSFYREISPGLWAWTCAPELTVQATPSRYYFKAKFPTGLSHFMAIYGLKPFSSIKLYGINYGYDAEFEIYNVSGYLYRKPSNALYLKMRHKTEVEGIDLYF